LVPRQHWNPPLWQRRAIRLTGRYAVVCVLAYLVSRYYAVRYVDEVWARLIGVCAATGAATLLARLRARRVDRVLSQPPGLRCPRCRYNLRFNTGHCPECGSPSVVSTGRFAEVRPVVQDDESE
jgi:lipopolysaccharide biosynthesis regulator YciM